MVKIYFAWNGKNSCINSESCGKIGASTSGGCQLAVTCWVVLCPYTVCGILSN